MKKILLVDDVEVTRQFTEIILSTMYEIFCASTGADAVKIFRDTCPQFKNS